MQEHTAARGGTSGFRPAAAAIAAASELKPGRYPECSDRDLYHRVLQKFLHEWPLSPRDIDGLLVSPAGMAAGTSSNIFIHEHLGEDLGLKPVFAETINAGGATHGLMVQRAALAVAAGRAQGVLCVAAGGFPKVREGGAEANARMACHPDFDFLYGPFIVPLYAQAATRHMHEFGTTKEQLAKVAVSTRRWALKHPDALMRPRGPLTVQDVLASRPIASPFNLLDCSVPCDGGAAVLVASPELAQRLNPQPAYVLGCGEAHTHANISQATDLIRMGGAIAAEQAYRMAGLGPADVDLAELYDSFSFNPVLNVENMGFVPRGEGGKFWDEERGGPDGDLPINTYGGLLSFGHTGDASGMSMLVEGALQIMGRAGERQVAKANVALVHSYGNIMSEHSVVLLGRQS
ncbi:MAG TPA: thiolase family protein [Gammaproteobacteria bacterium]|nr:thiolase family protein [Gammaproteobacteria bacterium]